MDFGISKSKHSFWGIVHIPLTGFLLVVLTSFIYAGCTSAITYYYPDPGPYALACLVASAATLIAILFVIFFCTYMEHGKNDIDLVYSKACTKFRELFSPTNNPFGDTSVDGMRSNLLTSPHRHNSPNYDEGSVGVRKRLPNTTSVSVEHHPSDSVSVSVTPSVPSSYSVPFKF